MSRKKEKAKWTKISVSMLPELKARVEQEAADEHRSVSSWIRRKLDLYFDSKKK